jgi:hypothetical protein
MATDLPEARYREQVLSGRDAGGGRHDGAGNPLPGMDRITTEDWEIGRVAGHLSIPYVGAVTGFNPIRYYRTQQHHDAGVDRLVIFGELTASGGGSGYQLAYRLGDAAAFTPFVLGGADLTQWYGGSDFGTLNLDITSVIEDWITLSLIVTGTVYVFDLGGWLESSTLPVI